MARAPFQILVFPYRKQTTSEVQYAIFSRADYPCWQGIAGGGEDNETPLEAAKRECFEEAGITPHARFIQLDTINSIPVTSFRVSYLWGEELYVIPEYSFGVNIGEHNINLSPEHKKYRWVDYETAIKLLKYDSNKTALWELNQRILGKGPRD